MEKILCLSYKSLCFRERQYTPTDLSQVKEFDLFVVKKKKRKEVAKGLSPHIMCPLGQSCSELFPWFLLKWEFYAPKKNNSVEMSHSFKICPLLVCLWEVAPAFSDKRNVSLLLALQSQLQCGTGSWTQAILVHQQQHCHLICKHRTIMIGKDIQGILSFRFQLDCEGLAIEKKKNLLILSKCDVKV